MIGAFQAGVTTGGRLWTPDYGGVKWWIDASDSNTITLVSGNVSQISDKSGNGYHTTQASSGARPTPVASAWNGMQGIEFTESVDWMQATVSGYKSLTNVQWYFVTKPNAEATADVVTNGILAWGNSNNAGGAYPATKAHQFFIATALFNGEKIALTLEKSNFGRLGSTIYARSSATADILHVGLTSSGTTLSANGNSVSLDLASEITTSTDVTPNAIGYTLDDICFLHGRVANGSFAAMAGNITMLEVILATNTTYHEQIEGYLAHKWGLAGNLPSTHSYKNAPPTS